MKTSTEPVPISLVRIYMEDADQWLLVWSNIVTTDNPDEAFRLVKEDFVKGWDTGGRYRAYITATIPGHTPLRQWCGPLLIEFDLDDDG